MAVSCNADILPLKVVILISLKNYAVNQMRTAGVRIRKGTLSAVQTKISSKTADAPYPLSIITSYCEIPFSTHHSFHMPRMVSQGCTPPLTTCTQPFNFKIGTGGIKARQRGDLTGAWALLGPQHSTEWQSRVEHTAGSQHDLWQELQQHRMAWSSHS